VLLVWLGQVGHGEAWYGKARPAVVRLGKLRKTFRLFREISSLPSIYTEAVVIDRGSRRKAMSDDTPLSRYKIVATHPAYGEVEFILSALDARAAFKTWKQFVLFTGQWNIRKNEFCEGSTAVTKLEVPRVQ
jgi:hypothetical protein